MRFQKGNKAGPGGIPGNKGGGRPPKWEKQFLGEELTRRGLIERYLDIASGKHFDQVISKDTGEVLPLPAPLAVQKDCIEYLIDRVGGKADDGLASVIRTILVRPDKEK